MSYRPWCLLFLLASLLPLQAGLDQAAALSARHGERALLVWQKGRLLQERYQNGGRADKAENLYSITKSLCALGLLTAAGRGSIDLDEPVSQTLTEWQNDPLRKKITVRQLLTQTSGLNPGFEALYNSSLQNKNAALLKLQSQSAPGSTFAYGPSHYEALATYIGRKTGKSPSAWEQATFLGPVGIKPTRWRTDRQGNPYFSAGLHVTANELLQAAHIVRRQGWIWILPLIPSRIMREAAMGSPANRMYGTGLWLNRNVSRLDVVERDVEEAISDHLSPLDWERSCLSKAAPADLVAFVGSNGQRVYISPSRNLIIVRLGRSPGLRDPDFLRAYFK